ncbi:MAG: hypothetical protein KAY32_05370 [Candidatus Eisenbacteria sp.]|nr:hypothetical protein [Candidatus Eisenbacteria bacterium]
MRWTGFVMRILLCATLFLVAGEAWGDPLTGPDARYYDYDEILALCDQWAADHPVAFHREIIGYSGEGGEPIWAIKISDHAAQHEPQARILIHGAQHSNEPSGTNAIVFMIDRLLSRYNQPGVYRRWADNLELWFVPIVNVAGHRHVFAGGDNWDWWRKTNRDNNSDSDHTFPVDGVDPNRNWDYRWAEYDSTAWTSSRYKGPAPFSEPCVVAIRDLILRERPVFVMDLHSPDAISIANRIWWPWWEVDKYGAGPDGGIYSQICEELAGRCETEDDGVYVDGTVACYNTLPKEQCWVYKNTGICTYLYEISDRFWWTGAMVDTVAHRAGRGLFYLMERAYDGPGLTGTVTSATLGIPLEAEVKVHQVHDCAIGPRMTEQFFGQYWRLLNSGSYTVTVTAPDHYSQTEIVYVGASGWTHLDFELIADPAAVGPVGPISTASLWFDTPMRAGGDVHFRLENDGFVSLQLLDVTGRPVQELVEGRLQRGVRTLAVDRALPSGAYLLRLRVDDERLVKKLITVE